MAHLIEKFDAGIVNGTTWHKHPLYAQIDGPVPMEQAKTVGNFNVSKRQLSRPMPNNTWENVNAFALVRDDLDLVVYPSVSDTYTIVQNSDILSMVDEQIVKPSEGRIYVDSIGTLCNGGRFFVNLGFTPFQVAGDGSKYVSKIMVANMFGKLKNLVAAHSTRVVCMNTLKMAAMEGALNKALAAIQHRSNIASIMEQKVIDFAEIYAGLDSHEAWLSRLATVAIESAEEDAFLATLFPLPTDSTASKTVRENRMAAREAVHGRRVNDTTMTKELCGSWYGMIQAVTNFADSPSERQVKVGKTDDGSTYWEGLYGKGDRMKQQAVALCPVK